MAAKNLSRFQPTLVLTTTNSLKEARRLARLLLDRKVAGCVNILPRIDSLYWWQGKIDYGKEVLLLIKSSRRHLPILSRLLKSHHSYEVPELIALSLSWGEPSYLNWLKQAMERN